MAKIRKNGETNRYGELFVSQRLRVIRKAERGGRSPGGSDVPKPPAAGAPGGLTGWSWMVMSFLGPLVAEPVLIRRCYPLGPATPGQTAWRAAPATGDYSRSSVAGAASSGGSAAGCRFGVL